VAEGRWQLARATDRSAVDDLATAWATRRPDVLRLMTGRAVGRIRASAAQTFADAFRLRRRKDEGDDHG
jgi:hypothetical protein